MVSSFTDRGSIKVALKISHLRKLHKYKYRLGISNTTSVQLPTLVKDSLNNRNQRLLDNLSILSFVGANLQKYRLLKCYLDPSLIRLPWTRYSGYLGYMKSFICRLVKVINQDVPLFRCLLILRALFFLSYQRVYVWAISTYFTSWKC
jgi:hypothetical protein